MPERNWRVPQFPHPAGPGAPGANVPRRRLPHAARQHARARPAPAYQWAHAARIRIRRAALRAKHAQGGQGGRRLSGARDRPSRGSPGVPGAESRRSPKARPFPGVRVPAPALRVRAKAQGTGGSGPGTPPEGASGGPKCPGHRFPATTKFLPPGVPSAWTLRHQEARREGATLRAQESCTCSGGFCKLDGAFPDPTFPPLRPASPVLGVPPCPRSWRPMSLCIHPRDNGVHAPIQTHTPWSLEFDPSMPRASWQPPGAENPRVWLPGGGAGSGRGVGPAGRRGGAPP